MAPTGKYFQLVSQHSGHALGVDHVEGATVDAPLVICERNEADDHQVWYEEKNAGTINLKVNGLCLHLGGDNKLLLRPVEAGHSGQQWTFKDGKIQNGSDPDKVLDVCGSKTDPGTAVCTWSFHGGQNQLWDKIFVKLKFFYLKSELNGMVLDVEGECPDPGTKLCMWDQKPEPSAANQLWYEDQRGFIRSRLNDFVIDSTEPNELTMQPFDTSRAASQSWVIHGNYVALAPKQDKVLDIVGQNREGGARICSWEATGNANQKWIVEYV